ncbi:hypothetical protein ACFYY2_07590 [Streptomyces sp. NPDC001822]|uniref:hypothetical protein n=1 Tax=Streptomyces sp. NPDC001822 TaxID=3364614 RepID=UPI0036A405F1
MIPSIQTPESIRFEEIQEAARVVLSITRIVEEWSEQCELCTPRTDEWNVLRHLANAAERLALSLPVELLPPEEVRPVGDYELSLAAELLDILAAIERDQA